MADGDLTATNQTYSSKKCAVFDGVDDYVEVAHNANQLGANLSNGFTIGYVENIGIKDDLIDFGPMKLLVYM